MAEAQTDPFGRLFVFGVLGVCASTLELLKQRKIMTHQLPTKEAVDKYNALITQGLLLFVLAWFGFLCIQPT